MHDRLPLALVVVGLILLVVPSLVSAIAAPDIDQEEGSAGDILVSLEGTPDGRVSWYDSNLTETWSHTPARSYFAVQTLPNDRIFFTWKYIRQSDCGSYSPPCARTGFTIYDRSNETVVRNWSIAIRSAANSEIHDAEVLDDGRVLVADMDRERIFLVNEAGNITWQWNASSFYEPPPNPTRRDWLHINDVDRIGEGRFLVSPRNSNQLLVIERGEGVVEVINAEKPGYDEPCTTNGDLYDADDDGDVRCGDPALLSGQHNPHWLGNGTVLVADSLNDRIVQLERQPDGKWTPTWTVRSVGGVPLDWPRDADRLPNGNTIVADSYNHRVVMVRPNGTLVWSMHAPGLPYEADRLPEGELDAGALEAEIERLDDDSTASRIPLVSRARIGLIYLLPVPYWFSDLHMLGAIVGIVCLLLGGGLESWRRLSARRQ